MRRHSLRGAMFVFELKSASWFPLLFVPQECAHTVCRLLHGDMSVFGLKGNRLCGACRSQSQSQVAVGLVSRLVPSYHGFGCVIKRLKRRISFEFIVVVAEKAGMKSKHAKVVVTVCCTRRSLPPN